MADTSDAELAIERLMNKHSENRTETAQTSTQTDSDCPSAAPVPHLSRLIRDTKGKFMFIGDSANLSLLQNIRRLVEASIGSCTFVADPLRYLMVEDTPDGHPHWLDANSRGAVQKPSLAQGTELIRQYMLATNCVLDLFDEPELLENLPSWLEGKSEATETFSPMYYLILAIGAQTSPDDRDDIAETYFNHGRYLTALRYMEEPSILTVQAYALITMFMLGASRRNAAFMNLGIAVRAAYALGIHKREVSDLFSTNECRTRERLWKVIRVLDLFMSASLGRPLSTFETRDTTAKEDYSASASLCAIFEMILTEVYGKRMVSTEVVEIISERHRQWTSRLHKGLGVDAIQPTEDLLSGQHPNIGLYHVKEAYYWTIILLTRPFLIEQVASRISMVASNGGNTVDMRSRTTSNQPLVDACVDSAVRTIELLRGLAAFDNIPKRLPFVVNSIFLSALVIGVAFFGDLDRSFPLKRAIRDAQTLLRRFDLYDAQAKRNLMIIEYLEAACNTYTSRRDSQRMEGHSKVVGGIFGNVHKPDTANSELRGISTMQMDRDQPRATGRPLDGTNAPVTNLPHFQAHQNHAPRDQETQLDDRSSSWITSNGGEATFSGEHVHDLPNGLDSYQDPTLAFSPQILWFDSYEENMPLFSTFHTGHFQQT